MGESRSRRMYLPAYEKGEAEEELAVPSKKGLFYGYDLEVVREVVLVGFLVLVLLWLLLGGNPVQAGGSSSKGKVSTTSPFIVPSIVGSDDMARKAPGDNTQEMSGMTMSPDTTHSYQFSGGNSPEVVVVTVLDDTRYPREYLRKIVDNRVEYAKTHNYGVFIRFVRDFRKMTEGRSKESSFYSRAVICRESLQVFPDTKYFWFLDESAIIMNPMVDIVKEFIDPAQLGPKMLRHVRVVRDLPHISTFRYNPPEQVEMVFTRDTVGLAPMSFIYKNTVTMQSLFDLWFDPVYRWNPGFNDDGDALRHMVQWHPHYLGRLAAVNPKFLLSFAMPPNGDLHDELGYTDGDFVAYFNCDYGTEVCRKEFQRYWNGRGRVGAK